MAESANSENSAIFVECVSEDLNKLIKVWQRQGDIVFKDVTLVQNGFGNSLPESPDSFDFAWLGGHGAVENELLRHDLLHEGVHFSLVVSRLASSCFDEHVKGVRGATPEQRIRQTEVLDSEPDRILVHELTR